MENLEPPAYIHIPWKNEKLGLEITSLLSQSLFFCLNCLTKETQVN